MMREEDIRNAFEKLIMELDRDLLRDPREARKEIIMAAIESVKYKLIGILHKEESLTAVREEIYAKTRPKPVPTFASKAGLGGRESFRDTELLPVAQYD